MTSRLLVASTKVGERYEKVKVDRCMDVVMYQTPANVTSFGSLRVWRASSNPRKTAFCRDRLGVGGEAGVRHPVLVGGPTAEARKQRSACGLTPALLSPPGMPARESRR